VASAAAVARAVFPGVEAKARPRAVALVDQDDWRGGVAAAALFADPIGAPVLLTDGKRLPAATREAIDALAPTGAKEAGDAQVIRVGDVATVKGNESTDVTGKDPYELAARVDALVSAARGKTSDHVIVTGARDAAVALPAAGWAAKTGDPVLYTQRDRLPAATRQAISRHQQPKIYVLGGTSVVSKKVEGDLRRLGTVKRIDGGKDPVAGSIAFARYVDGSFGWGVVDPGHGLVFVDAKRPLDAVAAAPFSASGTYGPLLLHEGGAELPKRLESYLLDIQPGYRRDPVRGVYNHGWVIGDEAAMPTAVQSRIDALLEISPVENDTTPSS
jgi:hypothetical protein